jgi:rRNA maturation endonuclease Nob1
VPCLGCGIGVKSKMGLCMSCGHDRVAHKHAYESRKSRAEFLKLAAIDV